MHNERSNAIGLDQLWSWFGGGWGGFKGKKWQKGVKKLNIFISHDDAKISHSHAKWTIRHLCCKPKENLKVDFAWPCKNFAQSCKTLHQDENAADGFSTLHHHAKLLGARTKMYFLQIPWWISLRKTS